MAQHLSGGTHDSNEKGNCTFRPLAHLDPAEIHSREELQPYFAPFVEYVWRQVYTYEEEIREHNDEDADILVFYLAGDSVDE